MFDSPEQDPCTLDSLFALAREVRARAYAPYSRFYVGAAILSSEGGLFAGANVENAAYPVGTCAEAGAISAMVAGGHRRIAAALIIGTGEELVSPCGACRQRLNEFASPDTLIHMADDSGIRRSVPLGELLPYSFGPAHLDE